MAAAAPNGVSPKECKFGASDLQTSFPNTQVRKQAVRAGATRMKPEIYHESRHAMHSFLHKLLTEAAIVATEVHGRTELTVEDVLFGFVSQTRDITGTGF